MLSVLLVVSLFLDASGCAASECYHRSTCMMVSTGGRYAGLNRTLGVGDRHQRNLHHVFVGNLKQLGNFFFKHEVKRCPGRTDPARLAASIKFQAAGMIEPSVAV